MDGPKMREVVAVVFLITMICILLAVVFVAIIIQPQRIPTYECILS